MKNQPLRKSALFLSLLGAVFVLDCLHAWSVGNSSAINLAPFATASTSFVSGHESLEAINTGYEPRSSNDHSHGAYGNWPQHGTQWVEYRWSRPISTARVEVHWWQDGQGVALPTSARLLYWNGSSYVPVPNAFNHGVATDGFNNTTFPKITSDRIRLEFASDDSHSTGILQWAVIDSGDSPQFAPILDLGNERVVIQPAGTRLDAKVRGVSTSLTWSKVSGPGSVNFDNSSDPHTRATFSATGRYTLRLSAANGVSTSSADLPVDVHSAPASHLDPIFTTSYTIDSPLWSDRTKQLIVHWIPHLIEKLSDPNLPEGGLQNFIEAGKANAGQSAPRHVGSPWSDAYTHNAVESMCLALEIDPRGDQEIIDAQKNIRATLDKWIPIILAAQEPDGYLQTRFTLGQTSEAPAKAERWTQHGEHEGYTAGYFIDSAIADYLMTGGKDRRMYDAAKKLADCWDAHIGPAPKMKWYDGHEEIEQSLVSLSHLVDQVEGPGKGDRYVALAHFLLSCRGGGTEYDQTQAPVVDQYYAAGHAVRAAYCYSAMADIAMETGDPAYHTAVSTIWDDLVNRKYYVTGGIGSGDTSEGFGKAYSLSNNAYCESCSGCGEIFFQHKMNLAYEDAKYIDLLETTLYNAVLSDVDLTAENFTYTNPLDTSAERYKWHTCPCCVGNIPRTIFMLPTWMYATGPDSLYVNLFVGSTVNLSVSGKPLKIQQVTNYPQTGHVEFSVDPGASRHMAIYVRVPDRAVSHLYQETPSVTGIQALTVNGKPLTAAVANGYVRIERDWAPGDKVTFDLPMQIQRVHADSRVLADRGRVALQYGPLVYTFEAADQQNVDAPLAPGSTLTAEWKPDMLRGVTVITGKFADGTPLTAIPYYARNNRGGRSAVWINEQQPQTAAR